MSISVVQSASAQNGLAQTFNVTLGAPPTEGNLLVCLSFHDESAGDVEGLPGSGYTRLATAGYALPAVIYRVSVFAKFAGAAESASTLFDFGEVNRRGHGWAVEFTGQLFTNLQATDTADKVDAERDPAGTSLQVGPITIPASLIGVAICGLIGTSATEPNWSGDPDVTDIGTGLSANFRASGIGWVEGSDQTISPTATWGSNRQGDQILAIVGVAPPGSTLLKGSTFRVTPVG